MNTSMDVIGSLMELIGGNLAKCNNNRRVKLNCKIVELMDVNDSNFVYFDDRTKLLWYEVGF